MALFPFAVTLLAQDDEAGETVTGSTFRLKASGADDVPDHEATFALVLEGAVSGGEDAALTVRLQSSFGGKAGPWHTVDTHEVEGEDESLAHVGDPIAVIGRWVRVVAEPAEGTEFTLTARLASSGGLTATAESA